ncbi:hypothetical protein HMPREF0620_1417 [Parascardovia denticolens DSM 10105 = JCM 12538]|uniref:Uncharacterized protein n=1 Tax=Parascardovia denticolens DSM 10105 = JCM 12538 TaxID=864564 RepID=E6K1U4_PARDN|nr:hypothetical protein HMPREF0620_1417 [Parascardovia denticolens DSM 10105 = JCM 12538]
MDEFLTDERLCQERKPIPGRVFSPCRHRAYGRIDKGIYVFAVFAVGVPGALKGIARKDREFTLANSSCFQRSAVVKE